MMETRDAYIYLKAQWKKKKVATGQIPHHSKNVVVSLLLFLMKALINSNLHKGLQKPDKNCISNGNQFWGEIFDALFQ